MHKQDYDVIIIGGSYSGLAAGMALGRALRKVLIIDGGKPCNRQTPHSHNFITHDGKTPSEISILAKVQVLKYETVKFQNGTVLKVEKTTEGFKVTNANSEIFYTKKVVIATGIKDLFPAIKGFSECWGISILHCPFCHGYEVRNQKTGILGNGDIGYELSSLISNWTRDLTLYTNGKSNLSNEQQVKLKNHNIGIVEKEIKSLKHNEGQISSIVFSDGTEAVLKAIYARVPFEQSTSIPADLGCELTEEGYIKVSPIGQTTVNGVYASGDGTSKIRTVANAIASGTTVGMMVNKELIEESF